MACVRAPARSCHARETAAGCAGSSDAGVIPRAERPRVGEHDAAAPPTDNAMTQQRAGGLMQPLLELRRH
jgi:hypothetical protein